MAMKRTSNLYYAVYCDLKAQLFLLQRELGRYGVSYADMRRIINRLGYPRMDGFFEKLANEEYCDITLYQLAVWKRTVRNHIKDIESGCVLAPGLFDFANPEFE